jgi:hypothetical protein
MGWRGFPVAGFATHEDFSTSWFGKAHCLNASRKRFVLSHVATVAAVYPLRNARYQFCDYGVV